MNNATTPGIFWETAMWKETACVNRGFVKFLQAAACKAVRS